MKKYRNIYYLVNLLYSLGVAVWSGTIYLFMHHIGYSYGEINFFLSIFWVVTFIAEIPSGFIADHLGYLKTASISNLVRATGLAVLALSPKNFLLLALSAFLTALGDSLMSGTLPSWIANKAALNDEKDQLGEIYSTYSLIASPFNMIVGFIGAHFLANIDLRLPLLTGAAFLAVTFFILVALFKYDSQAGTQKLSFKELNVVSEVKEVITNEYQTFKFILLCLPIWFISSGPIDQWQLYFQHGKRVDSGSILVAIGIVGYIGSYIYRYLYKKKINQLFLLIFSVIFLTISIELVVMLKGSYYLALGIFMIHNLFGTIQQMIQGTLLQESIKTEKSRATIVSVCNALDAGVSVLILSLNGYLSDYYGIGLAWQSLAIVGLVLFFGMLIYYKRGRVKQA